MDNGHESSDIEGGAAVGNNGSQYEGASHGESVPFASRQEDTKTTSKRATAAARSKSMEGTNASSPDAAGARKTTRRIKKVKKTEDLNAFIKYGSLLLLVGQMVGLVLLMRYSRTHAPTGQLYLASSAVFVMEGMKFIICCAVVFVQSGGTPQSLIRELHQHVVMAPYEVLKLCIPSLLYTVQNNLLYLALSNLDAASYQICYQLKILTTALFSAVMLKRQFSSTKWFSLIILTAGVAIVQLSGSTDNTTSTELIGVGGGAKAQNRFVGLIAVLCAACTSGFSGVYFEKLLKGSSTSLWLRNIQMGLPSVLIAYITVILRDAPIVADKGLLVGFTPMVWTVVIVQAVGGLIVAVVVKYADNVLKVFATSFSIVVSCIISAVLFDFRPNLTFILGAALVVVSTVLYSRPDGSSSGGGKVVRRRVKKPILPVTMGPSSGSPLRNTSLVM